MNKKIRIVLVAVQILIGSLLCSWLIFMLGRTLGAGLIACWISSVLGGLLFFGGLTVKSLHGSSVIVYNRNFAVFIASIGGVIVALLYTWITGVIAFIILFLIFGCYYIWEKLCNIGFAIQYRWSQMWETLR